MNEAHIFIHFHLRSGRKGNLYSYHIPHTHTHTHETKRREKLENETKKKSRKFSDIAHQRKRNQRKVAGNFFIS